MYKYLFIILKVIRRVCVCVTVFVCVCLSVLDTHTHTPQGLSQAPTSTSIPPPTELSKSLLQSVCGGGLV